MKENYSLLIKAYIMNRWGKLNINNKEIAWKGSQILGEIN